MPVTVAAAVATVTSSAIDGTETVPVLMSAVIAAAELSAGANGTIIDPDYTAASISAITLANPGVFTTSAAHGLAINDKVFITGVVGTTEVNGRSYLVNTVPSTTTFTLKTEHGTAFTYTALDTSGYTAWTSGGTVYRLFYMGQLIGMRVDVRANPSAWLKIDNSFTYIPRTSTRLNPAAESSANANNGGYVVLGYRSKSVVLTTTSYNDSNCLACATGGGFFALRTPNGESPSIVHETGAARNDWPTLISTTAPAEYRIEGLLIRSTQDSRKIYGGNSRNIGGRDKVENYACSGGGDQCQSYNTTYRGIVLPNLASGSETTANNTEFITSTFGTELAASGPLAGPIRGTRRLYTDCSFSGWWNGTIVPTLSSAGAYSINRYTHTITMKSGTTPIVGARIRLTRRVTGTVIGYDFSAVANGPEAAERFVATDSNGQSVNTCSSAFWGNSVAGVSGTPGTESYIWDCRARAYKYRTFSDDVFVGRNYGYGGLLAGVTEEVQWEELTNLTEADATAAAAITGLALSASGDTSGTLTVSAARTVAQAFTYYRQWIAQDANCGSLDSWRLVGSTLNLGQWNLTISSNDLTGGEIVTAATVTASLTTGGAYTYVNGELTTPTASPILFGGTLHIGAAGAYGFCADSTIISMTPTAPGTYIFSGTSCANLDLRNTSAHAITVQLSNGVTYTTANNTGGTITVTNPPIVLTISELPTGSDVVVLEAGTETVLDTIEDITGTSWDYEYATPTTVDIGVLKSGYFPKYVRGYVLSSSNASLPLAPTIDPSYVE